VNRQIKSFFFQFRAFDSPPDVAHFKQRHFNVEPFVARHFEIDVAVIAKVERREQERGGRDG
jgi:hypothetical protein